MTKLELEKRVEELEKQVKEMPDAKKLELRNSELLQELFDKKREFETKQEELKVKITELEFLSKRYNRLAVLFDEYMVATNDMIQTNKLFLRTSERAKELLEIKIKAYNGGEGENK